MTDAPAFPTDLRDQYRDITLLDVRPEGLRYRARLPDGSPVDVTTLSDQLASRLVDPAAFVASLRRTADLSQPAIPRLRVADRTASGVVHFACERRGAQPVAPTSLTAAEIAELGALLARSLHAVHVAGNTHGAITTARITKVGPDVQLDGLGLVDAFRAGGMSSRDAVLALSQASYIAPEVQQGADPDARSDVYGLGAALYELLTGKAPFGGRTTSHLIATVLSDEDAAAKEQASGPVVDAILRAIEANPVDRWPDADAFARALSAGATMTQLDTAKGGSGCLPRAAAAAGILLAMAALVGR